MEEGGKSKQINCNYFVYWNLLPLLLQWKLPSTYLAKRCFVSWNRRTVEKQNSSNNDYKPFRVNINCV